MLRGGGDAKINIRMVGKEAAKPRYQPFLREVRRAADGQNIIGDLWSECIITGPQLVKRLTNEGQINPPGFCQRYAASFSLEQLHP